VLRIAHELAGLSLAEADLLRRAMSHFDPGRQMQLLREKFIAGAQERCGVPVELGERIWEMMAAFAGYGFPKAHAASYAQVAWNAAWCKTHFPAEFMAAVLANWGGYYSQRAYLTEARRMGLKLRSPHINHAQLEFSVSYPDTGALLYMGLDQVRDLTRRSQERILRGRPFGSLADFLARVDPSPKEAENLIRAGALEGLGTIPGLLAQLNRAPWQMGQMALFSWDAEEGEEWPLAQRLAAQEEILGISVDAHPLELYAEKISSARALSTTEALSKPGVRIRVAGMRMAWHRSRAEKGGEMAFLTLEDLEGMLDVVIYPDVYRRLPPRLAADEPLLVTGILETDPSRGEPVLRAERVERLAG
jgi:DNA polymerase III alpha subunit